MDNKKHDFFTLKNKLLIIAFLLFLSLLHVTFVSTQCGIFVLFCRNTVYYGLGYPWSMLVWDIPTTASFIKNGFVTDSSGNILSQYMPIWEFLNHTELYASFNVLQSVIGFTFNIIFWFIGSWVFMQIWTFKKKYIFINNFLLLTYGLLITILSSLFSKKDLGWNLDIERGIPFPFLEKLHLAVSNNSIPYSNGFYFKPFIFIVDFIIITSICILCLSSFFKIKTYFSK